MYFAYREEGSEIKMSDRPMELRKWACHIKGDKSYINQYIEGNQRNHGDPLHTNSACLILIDSKSTSGIASVEATVSKGLETDKWKFNTITTQ